MGLRLDIYNCPPVHTFWVEKKMGPRMDAHYQAQVYISWGKVQMGPGLHLFNTLK